MTSNDDVVMDMKESTSCPQVVPRRQSPSCTHSKVDCSDCSSETPAADVGKFVQTRKLNISRQKQQVSRWAMTGIQCKKSRYKAHLHIKSFRIYTSSHATIDMAIDHQIILMQIRLAWTAAWQSNPNMWEEHPEQFASLCREVLKANGTSESEMGLKAF